jgi:exportin-1
LLGLCEMKRGKDNKAVIASNIMYIVGQYPRFLRAHWKFLKTVVNKLFEFMHELHEGVQDMACDTFIKISKKCHKHFVILQPGESQPFLDEILQNMPATICDLQPQQVHTFYEAIGYMIPSIPGDMQEKSRKIALWMELPNQMWDAILASIRQNSDNLNSPENIKHLGNILRTNLAACRSCGASFMPQIMKIFLDMLTLYRTVSSIISETVSGKGLIATKTPLIRGMRSVKKDTLRLVECYISQAEEPQQIMDSIAQPLLEAILGDYSRNIPNAREAEVLNVTAALIEKLGPLMSSLIAPILDSVFESTIGMISKDFAEYPEHRVGFFKLLQSTTSRCFPVLLQLPKLQFKLVLDSIVWAFKHNVRDIGDIGLSICLDLLTNMAQTDSSIANGFYQMFLLDLLRDVFFVLTDTDHKSGFKLQALLLAHIFYIVETGHVSTPIYDPSQVGSNSNMNNGTFLRGYVTNLIHTAFPHLQRTQVEIFVKGLFDLNRDIETFKAHLRDFLIQLKEFAGDNTDLFREEMELEQERKKKAEMEAAMMIPGMIKPSERPDDLED